MLDGWVSGRALAEFNKKMKLGTLRIGMCICLAKDLAGDMCVLGLLGFQPKNFYVHRGFRRHGAPCGLKLQ